MNNQGEFILQYKIVNEIDRTNHAILYQVKDKDSIIALKIGRSTKPIDNNIVTREYQILKTIKHPNIVEVFDYGQFEDRTFFTLEYVNGLPVNKSFHGFSISLIDGLLQITGALGALHRNNFIHCDLNPANILYDASNKRAVLIDFGFATEIGASIEPAGTIGYIAPEVFKGIAIDQRSDLYSLGIIISEIISSQKQIDADTVQEPEDLILLRQRMVAKEPALRPNLPEVNRTLAKYASHKETSRMQYKINIPTTVYIELPELTQIIKDHKKGLLLIKGENGTGKTRIIKELRFKFIAQKYSVFHYSANKHINLLQGLIQFTNLHPVNGENNDKFQIFELICNSLRKTAQQRQLVILMDEIEDFTQYELELLRYLIYGLQDSGVIFIGAHVAAASVGELEAKRINIRCFNLDETNLLIAKTFVPIQILSGQNTIDSSEFTKWLYQQTNGNPLFIVELMRSLNNQGILSYTNNRWNIDMQSLSRIEIPEQLEGLINEKLNALSSKQLLILKLAAISDTPLPVNFIAVNLKGQVETDITILNAGGFLNNTVEGSEYCIFVPNQLLRSALLKMIPDQDKKKIGKNLIHLIKGTKLSDKSHYIQILAQFTEPTGTDEAAEYLTASAVNAARIFDYNKAINYLSRAQKIHKKNNNKKYNEITLRVAELYYKMGSNDQAIQLYQKMLDNDDHDIIARANNGIGMVYSMTGKYDIAIEHLEKALKMQSHKNAHKYLTISNQLAYALMSIHRFNRAEKLLNSTLEHAKKINDIDIISEVLCYQSVNQWHKNNIKEAIKRAEQALDYSRHHKLYLQIAYAEGLLSSLYQRIGSYEKAEKHTDQTIALYTKMCLINNLCHALNQKAHIQLMLGELNEAIILYHDIINRARQINNHQLLGHALANLGAANLDLGNFSIALEHYQEAIKLNPDDYFIINNIAHIKLIQGKIKESMNLIKRSLNEKDASASTFTHAALINQAGQNFKEGNVLIKKAIKTLDSANYDHVIIIETLKMIVQFYIESKDYANALEYSQKIITQTPETLITYLWAFTIVEICQYASKRKNEIEIDKQLKIFKTKEYLYDYALIKKYYFQALIYREQNDLALQDLKSLDEIAEIFSRLGAELELQRIKEIRAILRPSIISESIQTEHIDYLNVFSRLATIIHTSLGSEQFIVHILDLIIEATGAERGALFLATPPGMILSCGRNIDKLTLKDAAELSYTAIQEAGNKGILYTYNAISDPDYNTRRSVILNKIRAIMCIPLSVDNEIIGAVYVDSRIKAEIFNVQNETFLSAVCQILASIIQKSIVFARISEEKNQLQEQLIKNIGTGYMLGKSTAMKKLYRLVKKIAASNSPVLILGETGTGKGMLARYIHAQSKRKDHNFQIINCGTIPENLLESELFGHKKGAFTSAINDKPGLLEQAQAGTVFLDEITNTSPAFQAKILEAIEDKRIRRVGDTKNINISVRFLLATNQNLEIEVEENRFRKDLFYRINTFTIEVPPLRNRSDDIPLLAQFFMERTCRELNKKIGGFTTEATKKMKNYQWPGNVRELQNVIERAVVLAKSNLIAANDLFLGNDQTEILPLTEIKKDSLIEALNATGFNISHAAQILGVNRKTIQRYLKKYHLKK